MEKDQFLQDTGGRAPLRKESDASVGSAFGVKSQEVDVLGNEYAALVRGILKVLRILRRDQVDVYGRSDVDTALS